ncbi:Uncharacterized conserved protein YbjT, contains NAD(P)-binding and DUF2867 domains [Arenibacter palladensis]|uniref:Uncharacterized conserved protein YbjT, contains NAD(P)-binding and DUF2867 domains n=1 Tax=Arenibacter palladensis TaxID=237373 RepID=A0A1M5F500_9FLAO|nr:NAD(P)H-binding protein [Arenibacter palladensis]MDO6605625.1 NAD(P)H-binding protein [Arenibacter palladensis]SHF86604.1 Uncharacterized conserved protein YbjT, contains NAD(P)-binding and DUF2867 domains [Arenibacter palladensis]|tara:strand:+ start:15776 stop:16564 length:789 start_codon:yes stop_codon:yes gene_type:complete
MKRVLVTGGSGSLGKVIIRELVRLGYHPSILSKKTNYISPTGSTILMGDLTDKRSLPDINTDVIIHCASNAMDSENVDVKGTEHLIGAINKDSSPHLIYISIVGVDKSTFSYYTHKRKAEVIIENSKVPYTILRLTQFHDFVVQRMIYNLQDEESPEFKIPEGLKFQSIDITDASKYIAELVEKEPLNTTVTLGGPEVMSLKEMAQIYFNQINRDKKVIEVSESTLDSEFYAIFRSGSNLCPENRYGSIRWSDFLSKRIIEG